MRRLGATGRAGCAGGAFDALQIEGDQQRLAAAPGNEMFVVFGTRRSRSPFTRRRWNSFEQRRFEAVAQRSDARGIFGENLRASSAALPMPTMPGTFSVPGRRSRSAWPPKESRRERRPGANVERAHALWAVKLVRGDRKQIDAEAVHVERHLAGRLHGVAMEAARPLRRRCAPISSIGWIVPSSLFACITVISTVSGRSARRIIFGIDDALRIRAEPTGTTVTSIPCRSSSSQLCSTA